MLLFVNCELSAVGMSANLCCFDHTQSGGVPGPIRCCCLQCFVDIPLVVAPVGWAPCLCCFVCQVVLSQLFTGRCVLQLRYAAGVKDVLERTFNNQPLKKDDVIVEVCLVLPSHEATTALYCHTVPNVLDLSGLLTCMHQVCFDHVACGMSAFATCALTQSCMYVIYLCVLEWAECRCSVVHECRNVPSFTKLSAVLTSTSLHFRKGHLRPKSLIYNFKITHLPFQLAGGQDGCTVRCCCQGQEHGV